MNLKKFAAGATIAGALGAAALGFGAGSAQAKPHPGPPMPPIPVIPVIPVAPADWVPGDPPGHNPFGPPGQVMQGNPVVPGLTGVPPGHWGEPWLYGLPATWLPPIPGVTEPLPVLWDPDVGAWGVWWNDVFTPFT